MNGRSLDFRPFERFFLLRTNFKPVEQEAGGVGGGSDLAVQSRKGHQK